MPIQNPMRRLASRRSAGFDFGVSFGVVTLCRSSCRTSRRGLRRWAPQNRRAGRPVASAHRPLPCTRAAALLLSNDAGCLRALANVSASFYCNSPVLWPTTHCGRSWVPRWPAQEPRGGQRRKLSCERSSSAFPKMPAARPAPDRRPIPSLRSVIPQAASRARFALDQAPHQSRLGALLPLSLVGTRSCLSRDRFSQRWGASFSLRRLGAAYRSPALGGLRKLSLKDAKFLLHSLRLLEQPTLCHMARAASARPNTRHVRLRISHRIVRISQITNIFQSTNQTVIPKNKGVNQSSCHSLN